MDHGDKIEGGLWTEAAVHLSASYKFAKNDCVLRVIGQAFRRFFYGRFLGAHGDIKASLHLRAAVKRCIYQWLALPTQKHISVSGG